MDILLSTTNKNKLNELKKIFNKKNGINVSTPGSGAPDVIEDKDTFKGNALKKAIEFNRWSNKSSISDDSGLEVRSLNGAPGVYSARYFGDHPSSDVSCEGLLRMMKDKKDRRARFKTVIAMAMRGEDPIIVDGVCNGHIDTRIHDGRKFGYDPVFIPDGSDKAFSEMSLKEKEKYSSRAIAARKMLEKIMSANS